MKLLVAILALALLGFLLNMRSVHDAFQRYTGHLQIEVPGGCLDVAIDQDTSLNDRSGDTRRGFSIARSHRLGPNKWSFIARSGDTSDDAFVFSIRRLLDEFSPIDGGGCHILGGSANLKRVARKISNHPEVPYNECTMNQHRVDHTYMLFDAAGDALAKVQCGRTRTTHCSGTVEIGEAIFKLGMWENDVEELQSIRTKIMNVVRDNMTFKSRCSLW